jgi:hypothetical protein
MAAVAPAVVPEKRRASSRLREQPATRLRTALEERPNTSAQKPKEKKAPTRKPPAPSHSDSPKITDLLPSKPSDTAPLPTLGGIDEELLAGAKLQSIADRFVAHSFGSMWLILAVAFYLPPWRDPGNDGSKTSCSKNTGPRQRTRRRRNRWTRSPVPKKPGRR